MRLVIIESPFAGDIEKNLRYLRAAMRDCLMRGEAPFASHAMYTQPGVLDDGDPTDREHGIQAGFAWREVADATVVYTDLGTSRGMEYGIEAARKMCERDYKAGDYRRAIEYRQLGCDWEAQALHTELGFVKESAWPAPMTDDDKIQLIENVFDVVGWKDADKYGGITECAVMMLERIEAL